MNNEVKKEKEPIEIVQLARHKERPNAIDYIEALFTSFIELHGDGYFADDGAILSGLAKFDNTPCAIISEVKGKTIEENNVRNFGSPHPEGYRKAKKLGELAERFSLPIFTFIDTSGAYPGIGAEERGQARAIAENLLFFSGLRTPIIVTIIGEGGSGGALAIGVGDRILMLENSIYSVISPEGCSSILWKSQDYVSNAAKALKLTAQDLFSTGVIDEIIPEGVGAHLNSEIVINNLKARLSENLNKLKEIPVSELPDRRYKKLKKMFSVENEETE